MVEPSESIDGDDLSISMSIRSDSASVSWVCNGYANTSTSKNVTVYIDASSLYASGLSQKDTDKLSHNNCAIAKIVLSDDGKATIYIGKGLLFPDPDQSTCQLYYRNETKDRTEYNGEATIVRMPCTHNNWGPWTYNNKDCHTRQCLEEGCLLPTEFEQHSFDANGICSGCGRNIEGELPSSFLVGSGDKKPDLETDISSPSLPDDIQALPDSSLIGIQYSVSVNVTLQKDIFSIIQGTNKTIFLSDGRLQWAFCGKDILYPKAINLQVDISLLVNTTSPNKRPISNLVGNTPTSVLSFARNGQLPGKATITVSKETLFPNSSYTSFWVYHYDSTRNRLESIARNLRPTSDGYLNFDIWHNSDYIITGKELTNLGSGSSYKGPIDEHIVGSSTPSSSKDNPHTGA